MFLSIKHILFRKPYDVVFYYPQHFNRSEKGTNPFFDPLIALCEKNKLRYLVIEEPDSSTSFPRNKKAYRFDFWFYFIIISRKLIPLFFFKKASDRECFIGSMLRCFSMNAFKSKNYITISNSLVNVLLGLQKEAKVYELQHGIIYSWHWGYFDKKGRLNDFLNQPRIQILVYGKGYQNVFYKNNTELESLSPEKIVVLGSIEANVKKGDFEDFKNRKKVVFTLDFTNDSTELERIEQKKELDVLLESVKNLFVSNGFQMILKQHPRFNNVLDFDDLYTKYSFIEKTEKSLIQIMPEVFLHVTKGSTSTFEMAFSGIPTAFISNEMGRKVFIEEYQYPLENNDLESLIEMFIVQPSLFGEYAKRVGNWAHSFYEPINENVFLKLMRNNDAN